MNKRIRMLRLKRGCSVLFASGMFLGALWHLKQAVDLDDRDSLTAVFSLATAAWIPSIYAMTLTTRLDLLRWRR